MRSDYIKLTKIDTKEKMEKLTKCGESHQEQYYRNERIIGHNISFDCGNIDYADNNDDKCRIFLYGAA